jgi:hypothetical protein
MKQRYEVNVTVVRDFKRIVTAKTEAQAIRQAKENIVKSGAKIRMKDFDKQLDNVY